MNEQNHVSTPRPSGRSLALAAAVAAAVAGVAGFILGRAGTNGGPLSERPSEGAVVARFDGQTVTSGEIERLLAAEPEATRELLAGPAERRQFVEDWSKMVVFALRAEGKGYHRDPAFARRYAQELANHYVAKEVEVPERGRRPTDDEVRAYFAEHEQELQRPERVRIAVVTLEAPDAAAKARKRGTAEAALREALARAQDPYAFGNLARLRSEDVRSRALNGELAAMSRDELSAALGPEVAAAAFEASGAGTVLPRVVEGARALHVVKVIAREREERPGFDGLKELLRQRLSAERRAKRLKEFTEATLRDAGLSIDDAAVGGLKVAGGKGR